MLDVIVPVLNRPRNAAKVAQSLAAATAVKHQLWFVCSPGDEAELEACHAVATAAVLQTTWPAGPGDYAMKTNLAFSVTDAPFLFAAADDVTFTEGWDIAILAEAERSGAGMVGCDDGANPMVKRGMHSTHSLFRRSYIDSVGATFFDGPGVVYHAGYEHQWVDTEAVKAAKDRGQWAFARRALVQHHHPIFDRSVSMDTTYEKGLGGASHDSRLYQARLKEWTTGRRRGTVL